MSIEPPEPRRRRRLLSWIWALPLAALLAASWLAFQTFLALGPTIEITWNSADGLLAGQTEVLYKNVELGRVEKIALTSDHSHIVVTVRMDRDADSMLNTGTQFWVVRPRLALGQISGLDTIISGSYIDIEPGNGAPARNFTGFEGPPTLAPDVPGSRFTLATDDLLSVTQGAPVYFRGVPVGEVVGYELTQVQKSVLVHIFIRSPYDRNVRDTTRFWNMSGINISAGAEGLQIRTPTLQSILAGGIGFDTSAATAGDLVPEDEVFPLYADQATAHDVSEGAKLLYVVEFPDSLDGLAPNAVVNFQGIPVGHVESLKLEVGADGKVHAPVVFDIEPDRVFGRHVIAADTPDGRREFDAFLAHMIEHGLRARLVSANLITGQRLIALDFEPEATPAKLQPAADMARFPAIAGNSIAGIEQSTQKFVDKLAGLPLEQMVQDIQTTMHSANATINSPQMTRSLKSLDTALANLAATSESAKKQVPAILASLRTASDSANAALEGAQGKSSLGDALDEITEAARSLRLLTDYLERHPESLIRGKTAER
jgi:paraquat-inducible protein B